MDGFYAYFFLLRLSVAIAITEKDTPATASAAITVNRLAMEATNPPTGLYIGFNAAVGTVGIAIKERIAAKANINPYSFDFMLDTAQTL